MLHFERTSTVPGQTAALSNTENILWWGREQDLLTTGYVIDGASVDAGNTPTDILRPGLILGGPVSGKLKQWDPTSVAGYENVFGILGVEQNMHYAGTDTDRFGPLIIVGGPVRAGGLIIPGASAAGISGKAYEWLLRAQMTQGGRFLFDDQLYPNLMGAWRKIMDLGADADDAYTVLATDRDTLFHNGSDTDALTVTLPSIATVGAGFRCGVWAVADFAVTVAAAVANTIVVFNNAAADSVAYSTAGDIIGGGFEFISLATDQWLCIPHNWGDGVMVQTITITDA